jgi:ABC-type microcin C transport system permease subunit YejE
MPLYAVIVLAAGTVLAVILWGILLLDILSSWVMMGIDCRGNFLNEH